MKQLVHASLFSGFGAPDLAAEWMGWQNAFHCEIDEFCNIILNYWFKDAKSYTDIRTTDFREWRGKIDILTAGFPCQPFSVAGQRKGADDNRYLWPYLLRAIQEIRPDWVVGENVAGILTMVQPGQETEVGNQPTLFGENNPVFKRRQQYVVETICGDLEREGYSIQPVLIPACAVGAPHRRDRVWFIAHRDGTGFQTPGTEQPPAGTAGDHPSNTPAYAGGNRDTPCRESQKMEIGKFTLPPYPDSRREESQRSDGFSGFLRNAAGTNAGESGIGRCGREQS